MTDCTCFSTQRKLNTLFLFELSQIKRHQYMKIGWMKQEVQILLVMQNMKPLENSQM